MNMRITTALGLALFLLPGCSGGAGGTGGDVTDSTSGDVVTDSTSGDVVHQDGDASTAGETFGTEPTFEPFTLYAFSAAVDDNGETIRAVWAADANSPELRRLSDHDPSDSPLVSPDGQWVAYTSFEGQVQTGYVVAVAGGTNFELGKTPYQDLRWFPNSTALMFRRKAFGDWKYGTVNHDGSDFIEYDFSASDVEPTSSGDWIVYGGLGKVFAVQRDGTSETELATGLGPLNIYPAPADDAVLVRRLTAGELYTWTPTGTWTALPSGDSAKWAGSQGIVYKTSGGELRTVDRDGANDRLLAATVGDDYWPSPDGAYVAYVSAAEELHMVGIDGAGDAQLATSHAGVFWSPDSTHLAFLSSKDSGTMDQLFTTPSGTEVVTLQSDPAALTSAKNVAWAANSGSLGYTAVFEAGGQEFLDVVGGQLPFTGTLKLVSPDAKGRCAEIGDARAWKVGLQLAEGLVDNFGEFSITNTSFLMKTEAAYSKSQAGGEYTTKLYSSFANVTSNLREWLTCGLDHRFPGKICCFYHSHGTPP